MRKQHPAGKNISLDEVSALCITFKNIIGDHDKLDRRAPARFQAACDDIKIGRPIRLPYRFNHFDARNRIISAAHIAVVEELILGRLCHSRRRRFGI